MRLFCLAALLTLTACLPDNAPDIAPTPAGDGWQQAAPGVDVRTLVPPHGAFSQMVVLRIDPALYQFRVHYQPGSPLTLLQWQQALPGARVIVNANFFTPEHVVTGMLVSEGVVHGRSFTDRGGMFSIQNGAPVIQSLIEQPYDGRPLEQAIQAFPMLVSGGLPAYQRTTDLRPNRRTIIAMDSSGRVLLLATPALGLGLYDLSQYLPTAGLDLVSAFNLDGGGSTMLYIADTGYTLPSVDPVPAVLAVYAR